MDERALKFILRQSHIHCPAAENTHELSKSATGTTIYEKYSDGLLQEIFKN